ncbi:Cytochrome Oxidase Biogenesis (Oxa1) Family [Achlya hypogyna]|uniref:Cytochrome Oxidase Biogenesis (Oxa1) Family n=1 Tax=Achlya hypogyna TaxID=1202772 RepID=A0A1V9ZU20_ACHHY|nr:Cytochrome Oxidase Biogenesis (Oxa1) Family [Achlya hypogyna]
MLLGRRAVRPVIAHVGAKRSVAAFSTTPVNLPEGSGVDVQALTEIMGGGPAVEPLWIVHAAQNVIETVHATTGLPWWATFAASAVVVRGSLFPLLVYQIKAIERMAEASKDVKTVWKSYLYARLFLPPGLPSSQIDALKQLQKGASLSFEKHNTSPLQCISAPVVQIPSFFLMAYSCRGLVRSGVPGLDIGGFGPFLNLTEADPTFVLPALAVASTYLNFELMGSSKIKLLDWLKGKLQYIPLISFPFVCQLPQGVFFYWLASSWFSLAQSRLLKVPAVRARLGLKQLPSPSAALSKTLQAAVDKAPKAP